MLFLKKLLMFNDTSFFGARWDDLVVNTTPLPNWRGTYISAKYNYSMTNSTNDTATNASPWKTNLILFANDNGALEHFEAPTATSGIPQFSRSAALGLVNPIVSVQPLIPLSSLQKIDKI